MSAPRFVPIRGVSFGDVHVPEWPGNGEAFRGTTADDGSWFAWRLLGGNNRDQGRSALVFPSLRDCAADVRSLPALIGEGKQTVTVDMASGQWHWYLSIQGRRFAVSARRYSRQRECQYSMDQFVTIATRTAPSFSPARWAPGSPDQHGLAQALSPRLALGLLR